LRKTMTSRSSSPRRRRCLPIRRVLHRIHFVVEGFVEGRV
jgi:hypothetical protein